jgi:hypothetical protein
LLNRSGCDWSHFSAFHQLDAALRTSSVESPFEALRTATTPLVGRDVCARAAIFGRSPKISPHASTTTGPDSIPMRAASAGPVPWFFWLSASVDLTACARPGCQSDERAQEASSSSSDLALF